MNTKYDITITSRADAKELSFLGFSNFPEEVNGFFYAYNEGQEFMMGMEYISKIEVVVNEANS